MKFVQIKDQEGSYVINLANVAYVENATHGRYKRTRIVFIGEKESWLNLALDVEEVVKQLGLLTNS